MRRAIVSFTAPPLPDRVVALDLISILTAGSAAVYAIAAGEAVFLDMALILALIFLSGLWRSRVILRGRVSMSEILSSALILIGA
jgi:multisubunit Na+/H+ antiporter MnhF subunit